MSKFGWSYPAGASNDPYAPWNQEAPPCKVCGLHVDDCICPECTACFAVGDPRCYSDYEREPKLPDHDERGPMVPRIGHGMHRSEQQLESLAAFRAQQDAEAQERSEEAAAEYEYWWREQHERYQEQRLDENRNPIVTAVVSAEDDGRDWYVFLDSPLAENNQVVLADAQMMLALLMYRFLPRADLPMTGAQVDQAAMHASMLAFAMRHREMRGETVDLLESAADAMSDEALRRI